MLDDATASKNRRDAVHFREKNRGSRRRCTTLLDLRRNELTGLETWQIQENATQLYIGKSKAGQERWIPIHKKARILVKPWYEGRVRANGKYLFPKYNTDHPITNDHFPRTFAYFRDEAGVRSTIVPHGFRHVSITRWVSEMGLSDGQSLAGHSTPNLTKNTYTHLKREYFKKMAEDWNK